MKIREKGFCLYLDRKIGFDILMIKGQIDRKIDRKTYL